MTARAPLMSLSAAFALALGAPALAQDAPAEGAGITPPATGANYAAKPTPETAPENMGHSDTFEVEVSGYVRVAHRTILEDEAETQFVGRNDGFAMDNARLIVEARKGPLTGYVSIDGAVDRRDASNTATGRVDVGLKDAYVGYAREDLPYLALMAGQFKPAFDAEEDQSTKEMLFIDRAIESRGVKGVEGYNLDGLSLDRQVGLMVYGEPTFGPLAVGYYVSVTNGNGANEPLNDNDELAYTARVEVGFDEMVTAGVGFNQNRRTTGDELEDLIDEDVQSVAADLRADIDVGPVGLIVQGQFMQQTASFPDVPVEPDRVAQGYHASLGVTAPMGLVLAYRYGFLDPTVEVDSEDPTLSDDFKVDAVTHHTIALSWEGETVPLKAAVNYTIAQEEEGREVDNDRLDFLMQVAF